jgi:hypothetical protein
MEITMKHRTRLMLAIVAGCLGSSLALAEGPDCDKRPVPKNIEGQIIKIEPGSEQGKISLRTADGTIHEFHASKETLQDYKTGDTLKANLRTPPGCDKK